MDSKMTKAGKKEDEEEDNWKITLDQKFTNHNGKKIGIEDFDLLKVLGKGSFGKVLLVKKKGDPAQTLYAMKALRKAALIKRNQLLHTPTERNILQNIQHPFLVNLVYAFQTEDKLYMVLDYIGGGELFFWLKKHRRFSEPRSQLMGAEITLALGALHANNIIYRDLKPENILVDLKGHVRLTDFGLSKDGITSAGAEGGTMSFCGTPEYLAPEILDNKGHGKAVDWWSFGTLLYEMLCGLPPFYDTNSHKLYHKILCAPLRLPSYLGEDAKTILRGLLQRVVEERLGSGPTGTEEIKGQAFFKSLDFERVMRKEYTPEFKPPPSRSSESTTGAKNEAYEGSEGWVNFNESIKENSPDENLLATAPSPTVVAPVSVRTLKQIKMSRTSLKGSTTLTNTFELFDAEGLPVLLYPFLGPASLIRIDVYVKKKVGEALPELFDQKEIMEESCAFELVSKSFYCHASRSNSDYWKFQIYVRMQSNALIFQVLMPIFMVNLFLLISIIRANKEVGIEDPNFLATLLLALVYAYSTMRPAEIPNNGFDFVDMYLLLSLSATVCATFHRVATICILAVVFTSLAGVLVRNFLLTTAWRRRLDSAEWHLEMKGLDDLEGPLKNRSLKKRDKGLDDLKGPLKNRILTKSDSFDFNFDHEFQTETPVYSIGVMAMSDSKNSFV